MPPPAPLVSRRTRRGVLAALLGALLAYRLVYTAALFVLMGVGYGLWGAEAFRVLGADRTAYVWRVLVANALGQAVGLGAAAAWMAAHEHEPAPRFLRLGAPLEGGGASPWTGSTAAVVGLLGLLPLVQALGTVNGWLPLPDALRASDAEQTALFAHALAHGPLLVNLVLLALVPAVCEEVFFRGYVQRRLEVGGAASTALAGSALAFSVYHLRFGYLLPLAVVGLYLAYVVYRTQRLRPAIAAHFAYNAALIVLAWTGRDAGDLGTAWWAILPGALVTIWALRTLAPRPDAPRA